MSVFKRIVAHLGASYPAGSKSAKEQEESLCPYCHRQTQFFNIRGAQVCAICGKNKNMFKEEK